MLRNTAEQQRTQADLAVSAHHYKVGTKFGRVLGDGPGYVGNLSRMHVLCDSWIGRKYPAAQFGEIPLSLFWIGKMTFAMDLLRGVALDQMDQRYRRTKLLSELPRDRKRSLCQARTVKRDDQMSNSKFTCR